MGIGIDQWEWEGIGILIVFLHTSSRDAYCRWLVLFAWVVVVSLSMKFNRLAVQRRLMAPAYVVIVCRNTRARVIIREQMSQALQVTSSVYALNLPGGHFHRDAETKRAVIFSRTRTRI